MDDDDKEELAAEVLRLVPPAWSTRGGSHDDARYQARRIKAVSLRLAGATYQQIAEGAGYSNSSAARASVIRALSQVEAEGVADLRQLENARLDRAQAAIWANVVGPDVTVEQRVKAVHAYLRISERRARLNGLDAPVQVALTPTTAEVQRWVAEVLAAANPGQPLLLEADVTDAEWYEQDDDDDGEP